MHQKREPTDATCSYRNAQGEDAGTQRRGVGRRQRDGPRKKVVHALSYLGIRYSDDLTLIQLTLSDTHTLDQKKHLFQRIADHLAENPGLRREDIFINLVGVKKENWSLGTARRSTRERPSSSRSNMSKTATSMARVLTVGDEWAMTSPPKWA
jgi:hypothetical protein